MKLICCGVLLVGVLFVGCAPEENIETGPPEGWQAEGNRWWRTGFDTTGVFRNLESLATMGVPGAEATYVASPSMARQRTSQRQWFEQAVKQGLVRLYRNEPEVVDSLFQRHVVPMLSEASFSGNPEEEVERFKRKSYTFLHKNYFQAPQKALQIGRDLEVPYPEDLRKRQVGGRIQTQVYVDEKGEPLAVELLEGIEPALDGIAMRTMTQMRWRPAYLMQRGRWIEIPAWTRFTITFGSGSS